MASETIWSHRSNPSSPNMSPNYRSVFDSVDSGMTDLFGSTRNDQRRFSNSDNVDLDGNLFDFKNSFGHVSYAASTGGPHALIAPNPSKANPAIPLGTASISGGIANRHPPQDSFLNKFASIADATMEIELSHSIGTLNLEGRSEGTRRTSFNSEQPSMKPFSTSPHGSLNENLNMPSRNSRHQSISEKIDNYNNNSPIQASSQLSSIPDPKLQQASTDASNGRHQNFWNPATATSFIPNQSFNYFLDGSQPLPQQSNSNYNVPYYRNTPFFPPVSPPPFLMGGNPYVDGGMYGIPYSSPPPAQDDSAQEKIDRETANKHRNSTTGPSREANKSSNKSNGLPGIGLMNRSLQPTSFPGFMFQPFNPYSIYGPGSTPVPQPPGSVTENDHEPVASSSTEGNQKQPTNDLKVSHIAQTPSSNVPPTGSSSQGKKAKPGRNVAGNGVKSGHHIHRSPLLEEVRSNSKDVDYYLKDIYGHIVEFTKDQHGSRFIQQKLPTASEEEKEVAFNEIREISYDLMTDVFGNYVIQKYFEYGSDTQKQILLDSMTGNVYDLSLQMYGCRVVQRALEYIHLDGQRAIVEELRDYILICAKDQNGNHVIQKSIEKIPFEHVRFILESLKKHIYHLSTHPYGCRVIQRLLEYSDPDDQQFILSELKRFIYYLIQDQYGNYVIQHILEHGAAEDQEEILQVALGSIVTFSKHKFASNVIEKCIKYGSIEQKRRILHEVMLGNENSEKETVDDDSPLALMMKDQYANYVIQKLVEGFNAKSEEKRMLVVKLRQYLKQLSAKNNFGKHLASVEKMIVVAETALVEADHS